MQRQPGAHAMYTFEDINDAQKKAQTEIKRLSSGELSPLKKRALTFFNSYLSSEYNNETLSNHDKAQVTGRILDLLENLSLPDEAFLFQVSESLNHFWLYSLEIKLNVEIRDFTNYCLQQLATSIDVEQHAQRILVLQRRLGQLLLQTRTDLHNEKTIHKQNLLISLHSMLSDKKAANKFSAKEIFHAISDLLNKADKADDDFFIYACERIDQLEQMDKELKEEMSCLARGFLAYVLEMKIHQLMRDDSHLCAAKSDFLKSLLADIKSEDRQFNLSSKTPINQLKIMDSLLYATTRECKFDAEFFSDVSRVMNRNEMSDYKSAKFAAYQQRLAAGALEVVKLFGLLLSEKKETPSTGMTSLGVMLFLANCSDNAPSKEKNLKADCFRLFAHSAFAIAKKREQSVESLTEGKGSALTCVKKK